MYKIGLKLFSTNIEAINIAKKYFKQGLFDYIELVAIPNSFKNIIKYWESLKAPYIVHAPHADHGFNLSKSEKEIYNKKLFSETKKFSNTLKALFTIIHPGLAGNISETARQIKNLRTRNLVIENKPFISLYQIKCVGSSPEEIKYIKQKAKIDFCLDIVHAVKYAYATDQDLYEIIKKFLLIKPRIIHICDCNDTGCFDEHLNLGKGKINLLKILKLIHNYSPNIFYTLEVPEKSYEELKGFKKDRKIIIEMLENINKT